MAVREKAASQNDDACIGSGSHTNARAGFYTSAGPVGSGSRTNAGPPGSCSTNAAGSAGPGSHTNAQAAHSRVACADAAQDCGR